MKCRIAWDSQEPPRLLLSHDAKMPFACGLATPTIVLPAECESWSQERRLAVLLHELAHVRRRDLAGHTLGRLVCAVYWFHPLVWTAARKLRDESERACDDLALSCGTRATDYAEHLLDIVTSVRRETTPMVALAMARRKEFEGRMLAILDPELRHSTPSRRQSATLIGALAVISDRGRRGDARTGERAADRHAEGDVAGHDTRRDRHLDAGGERQRPGQPRRRERRAAPRAHAASARTSAWCSTRPRRRRPRCRPRRPARSTQSAERAGKALGGFVTTVVEKVVPSAVSAGLDAGARALQRHRAGSDEERAEGEQGRRRAPRAARQGAALRHERRAAPRRRVGTRGVRRPDRGDRGARRRGAPRRERVGARDGRVVARRRRTKPRRRRSARCRAEGRERQSATHGRVGAR